MNANSPRARKNGTLRKRGLKSLMKRAGATVLIALHAMQLSSIVPSTGWAHPAPPPPPNFLAGSIVASTAPIRLPGGGGVTDSGNPTYTLPLAVPQGIAGLQPDLAISYDGNYGALGVGLAIAGLSAITPCRKTFASEGTADGVDFDPSDALCLDGQKLIYDGTQDLDTLDDAIDYVYRTEVESFDRVVAHHATWTEAQPTGFDVRRRDGHIASYSPVWGVRTRGIDAVTPPELVNGGVEESQVIVAWVMTRLEDRSGNRIEYEYGIGLDAADVTETSWRIKSISYTFVGSTARRAIHFIYEPRPDPIERYLSGVKIVSRSRLKTIEMGAPNPVNLGKVWSYQLGYEVGPDTGRSRLVSVKQLDQFDVASWSRTFAWTDTAGNSIDSVVPSNPEFDDASFSMDSESWEKFHEVDGTDPSGNPVLVNPDVLWTDATDVRIVVLDADSDGVDDILYRTHPTRYREWEEWTSRYGIETLSQDYEYSRGTIRLRYSTAPNPTPLGSFLDMTDYFEPTDPALLTNPYLEGLLWKAHLGKTRFADLDEDGLPDLLLARTVVVRNEDQWQGPLDGGTDLFNYDHWHFGYVDAGNFDPVIGGFNPSKRTLIGRVAITGPVFRTPTTNAASLDFKLFTPPFQHLLPDLDGDGRVDHVDAMPYFAGDEPFDLLLAISENWFDYDSTHSPRPYRATLTAAINGEPGHFPSCSPADPACTLDSSVNAGGANWTCNNGRAVVLDYENDGRQDVLVATDDFVDENQSAVGSYVRIGVGDPFPSLPTGDRFTTSSSKAWGGDCGEFPSELIVGDWNGDGLEDLLYPPHSVNVSTSSGVEESERALVRWNLGNGFGPFTTISFDNAALAKRLHAPQPINRGQVPVGWDLGNRVVDVNRDGRADILAMRYADPDAGSNDGMDGPKIVLAFISQGNGFRVEQLGTGHDAQISLAEGFTTFQTGDFTGDGATDIVQVQDGKLMTTELPWRQQPDMLKSVGDSGISYPLEVFYYASWWNNERPTPIACDYPLSCSRRPFNVVRQHGVFSGTDSGGSPRYRTTLHTFSEPRSDLRGRGFLGFAEHRIWDRQLGAETIRRFDNETALDDNPGLPGREFYPYVGLAYETVETTPLRDLPTQAEMDASPNFPGVTSNAAAVSVRHVTTTRTFDVQTPDAARLLVLPSAWSRTEADVDALVENVTVSPQYVWWAPWPPEARFTTGDTTYDEFGNALVATTQTGGGVWTRVEKTYENRAEPDYLPPPLSNENPWLLGLVTRVEAQSYTVAGLDRARVTRTAYDAQGRVTEVRTGAKGSSSTPCVVQPDGECEYPGAMTTFGNFDGFGNPRSIASTAEGDPTPRQTDVYYDIDGVRSVQTVDPAGVATTTLLHPAFGTPMATTDANGLITRFKYDGFGRVVEAKRAGSPTVTRTYSLLPSGGLKVGTSSTDGSVIQFSTDQLGRPIVLGTRGFGATWSYEYLQYDSFGHVVLRSNPTTLSGPAWSTLFYFDRLGRPVKTVSPDTGTTQHEYGLLDATTIDPMGHETYSRLDPSGRIVETGTMVGGARYGKLTYRYGDYDQVTVVRDADGNETVRQYDPFGRVVSLDDPDAGLSTFGWDGHDQLRVEERANGDVITRDYDTLGRLTSIARPEGTEQRTYDGGVGGKHRLTSATSVDDVTVGVTYDAYGRMRTITQTDDGTVRNIDYRYDSVGRVSHLFYPVAGSNRFTTAYGYANGQLLSISDVSACSGLSPDPLIPVPACSGIKLWDVLGRNVNGDVTRARYSNTKTETRTYDSISGRLERLSVSGTQTDYDYDLDGNLISRVSAPGDRKETFTYDPLHRLDSWTLTPPKGQTVLPPVLTTYGYDELGDLKNVTRAGITTFSGVFGAQGKPHALGTVSPGSLSYTYDELGRQETGDGRTIGWNSKDLPSEITTATDTKTFRYDAFGNRVSRQTYDGRTSYVGKLYEHRESITQGNSDTFYVRGEPGLVAQVDYTSTGPVVRNLVGDQLASVALVMIGPSNVERPYFDPFGKRIGADGTPAADADPTTRVGFTGLEEDDANLVNMGGRIYDRKQFRFLSPDPVISNPRNGQAYNPYSYALNNPLRFTDPTGFTPVDCIPDDSFEKVSTSNDGETTVDTYRRKTSCGSDGGCTEPDGGEDAQNVCTDGDDGDSDSGGEPQSNPSDMNERERSALAFAMADQRHRDDGSGGAGSVGEASVEYITAFGERPSWFTPIPVQDFDFRPYNRLVPDYIKGSVAVGALSVDFTVDSELQVYAGAGSDPTELVKALFGDPSSYMKPGGGVWFGYLMQKRTPDDDDIRTAIEGGYAHVDTAALGPGIGITATEGDSADYILELGLRTPGTTVSRGPTKMILDRDTAMKAIRESGVDLPYEIERFQWRLEMARPIDQQNGASSSW